MIIPFAAISLLMIVNGRIRNGMHLQMPNLFGAMGLIYFVPQLLQLMVDPILPEAGLDLYIFMGICSLLAAKMGWQASRAPGPRKHLPTPLSTIRKATWTATILAASLVAIVEYLRPTMSGIQQWYGPIVIAVFFAQVKWLALAFSTALYLKLRTPTTIMLLVVNIAMCLVPAMLFARRTDLILIALTPLCFLWFERRRLPSLLFAAPALAALIVINFSVGDIRGMQALILNNSGRTASILSSDVLTNINFAQSVKAGFQSSTDIRNGVFAISAVEESGELTFGGALWNRIVFQYVPASLLGPTAKGELMVDQLSLNDLAAKVFAYSWNTGTTATGFATAFQDFWFLGAMYFYFMGRVMGRVFSRAEAGDVFSAAIYVPLLGMCLVSLTHAISYFYVSLPYFSLVIFLLRRATRIKFRLGRTT